MPIETHPLSGTRRRGRTPEEIVADQKEQAAKEKAQKAKAVATKAKAAPASTAIAPAKPATAVAIPDNRTELQKYLDEIAPARIVGRLVRFAKEGRFIYADDETEISESAEFIALCDETLVGWIRFHRDEEGWPPDCVMGLLYDGFVMPPRASLGDDDQTQWPIGLSGKPEDPWQHQICLVVQNTQTRELATFATTSQTGRRAVGNLLRHYDRMRKTHADELPVVRPRAGGFNHRDDRIGWVPVPVFAIVGRAPRDSAVKPDTSPAADLNDEIPFLNS
jgi:hypothetical protein